MFKSVPMFAGLLLAFSVCILGGCQQVPAKKGLVEKSVPGAKLSTKELRMMLNGFVARFANQVEQTADEIQAQSKDAQVQRSALLWKINATSACYRAAFVEDPLLGYIDVVVLCRQMEVFFTTGPGSAVFGAQQDAAVRASHELTEECVGLAAKVTSSSELVKRVEVMSLEYAQRDPIASLHFGREPPVRWYLDRFKPETAEVVEVVGNLAESLADMQYLAVLYSDHLPKEARWQAELLLMEMVEQDGLLMRLKGLESIDQGLQRAVKVAEQMPDLVKQQREALREDFTKQQTDVMQKLEGMLREALEDLTKQRVAIIAEVQDERQVVLKQAAVERGLALQESDAISQRRMGDMTQESVVLIDIAFRRGLELLGLLAVVLFAAALLARRRAPRTG